MCGDRMVTMQRTFDFADDHGLPGVTDSDGTPAPSTPDEARQAGIEAAHRGDALHEVVFVGILRFPGSARWISKLIAAAVNGWLSGQEGRQ
jgi:hypothetical protein